MSDAFFEASGAEYRATEHGRGPWSPNHMHAGPPSALMAREIERAIGSDPELVVSRITIELLRPIPIGTFTARLERWPGGRTVQRVGVSLYEGDRELARALAMCIRREVIEGLPAPEIAADPPAPPTTCPPFVLPFFRDPVGYHTAVELRLERGAHGRGPVRMWMRPRVPLVLGEPLSPLARLMICADSGNGVSPVLDTAQFTFVNPDLSVHLHRMPAGDWICLDARTIAGAQGIGMAETRLWDERGELGRGVQMLLVRPRA